MSIGARGQRRAELKSRVRCPLLRMQESAMKIKIVVHEAEEGSTWAEVSLPGCVSRGDSLDDLMRNLREAIEGCQPIYVAPPTPGGDERMMGLVV
jgi:predicted RNase H-like HicB family nuclease